MHPKQHSIGRDKAIKLYNTQWWFLKSPRDIVDFQLFTAELCMPFGEFHKAIEEVLGRPVFTHEFGYGIEGLMQEYLGEKPMPTMEQVMDLISENKQVIVITT